MELQLDFKEGPDAKLVSRTQIILIRTKGVPAYLPVAGGVATVEGYYNDYLVAMSAAIDGGPEAKTARDEKRQTLEEGLAKLGDAIILNSGGDPLYVAKANFKLRSNGVVNSRVPFEAPLWKNLERGILTGTLKGSVKSMPSGARGLLVEWRTVGSPHYLPVPPTNGKRLQVVDLMPNTKVEVRVRYFGSFGRLSNWSIPFPIDVV